MTKKMLGLSVLFVFLLAGCAPQTPAPTQAPSEEVIIQTAPPTEEPAPLPTEETPVEPTAEAPEPTEVPEPTATPVTVRIGDALVCVPPAEHDPMPETTYEQYPQAILDFLNAGGSPEELAVALILGELSPQEQPVWAEDLTGSGYRDVVVSVMDKENPPQGVLLIYTCQNEQYTLSFLTQSEQYSQTPKLLQIMDLNADGELDVVYTTSTCGASTCYEDIQIIAWAGDAFIPRLEGSTADLPYPNVKLTDYNHDGIYSLEVVGTSVASVGAGPQRDLVVVWDYFPALGVWKQVSATQAASPFRIHLVHDAEAAMDRREYLIASLLFQQVIEDDSLLDWGDPVTERANLSAYAYYKQIVADVFLGDRDAALARYGEMAVLFEDTDQMVYVEMANAFLLDSEVLGLEGGCTSAQQYASMHVTEVLSPLGSATYGYANPDFTPQDICP